MAHLVVLGLRKCLPHRDLTVWDEEHAGPARVPDEYDILILTSINPEIYSKFDSLIVPKKTKLVAVDTFDVYRPRPDMGRFDLVFLREYRKEHKDNKKIVPLNMGLTQERIERIRREAKPWKDREIDVFYRSAVDVCERVPLVEIFNNRYKLREYGFLDRAVDVAFEEMPEDEYYKRMGNAKVCLSPMGGGWDCYRHYEVMAAGAAPVMPYHWYWHPTGYRNVEFAMIQAQHALRARPMRYSLPLENESDKAAKIIKTVHTFFP